VDEVMSGRPRVRTNQVGYLVGRPMLATLVWDGADPVDFVVRDRRGVGVYAGRSALWPVRPEPTSGLPVQVLDFTGLTGEGSGYRIEAAGHRSHPFSVGHRLYEPLAADALRFFYVMRAGTVIRDEVASGYGRPAGHVGRPPNRGDREVAAWTGAEADLLYSGWRCAGTFDASGGWYDAGDFGKYVTSGAIAAWQLLSTLDLLAALDPPPSCAGLRDTIVAECRWQLDWLLRMQVPADDRLAGMAFHRVHGTRWPPLPCWPHEDPTERVLHRPSTGATLHLAAVTAQGARLLRTTDESYASRLLIAARTAYEAAHRHPCLIAPDDHARFGGGPYHDDDLTDDYYWAATELWLATGEDRYRADVQNSPQHTADAFHPAGFDFDRVTAPARLDLALAGGRGHNGVRDSVRRGADQLLDLQSRQPWGQPYAPATGWDWGSNGRILNNLVVLAVAHLISGEARYHNAVAVGMDYLLGRNALGQSYVTGYGVDSTRHQRTRQFGHDLNPSFPPPPAGAVAGGPNSKPAPDFPYDPRLVGLPPQCCYLDEPTCEVTNDLCIRWNAPLTWIATYLTATDAASQPASATATAPAASVNDRARSPER
jgi:endoglucanase